ncbi:hypothetical protein [Egicoccus sp. AB-alg6-2]|uniref:hypothetical protein n=1 Tax=Egicoccus sp. AB-alg6-2 TaxID=3242692 RepID=UPI00359DE81E
MTDGVDANEQGFVAGLEALAFGVLIFVLGTLVVVNAWAVVDTKFAASAAAREAVRAAVEAPVDADQSLVAAVAARQALEGHGVDAEARLMPLLLGLERCQEVAFEVRIEVPALVLPGLSTRLAPFEVVAAHREVVDPYRSGLAVRQGEVPGCGF